MHLKAEGGDGLLWWSHELYIIWQHFVLSVAGMREEML